MHTLVVGLVLVWVMAGLLGWLVYRLLVQNGRLLLRMEALEEQLRALTAAHKDSIAGQLVGRALSEVEPPNVSGDRQGPLDGNGPAPYVSGRRAMRIERLPFSRRIIQADDRLMASPPINARLRAGFAHRRRSCGGGRTKQIISFSLWGNDRKYIEGAKTNIVLARDIYAEWVVRIYCSSDVPAEDITDLADLGAECAIIDDIRGPWHGLFWRFYPASDPNVRVMISRDLDSRLNWREKAAVDDWLASREPFHIMRDHPLHGVVIPGGMWGVRDHFLYNMETLVDRWRYHHMKGMDQCFLARVIWPLIRDHHVAHDEIHSFSGRRARPFPAHRPITPLQFVGESVDP